MRQRQRPWHLPPLHFPQHEHRDGLGDNSLPLPLALALALILPQLVVVLPPPLLVIVQLAFLFRPIKKVGTCFAAACLLGTGKSSKGVAKAAMQTST
jgi:hypothetical protein